MAEELEPADRDERTPELREQPGALVIDAEVETEGPVAVVAELRQMDEDDCPHTERDDEHQLRCPDRIERPSDPTGTIVGTPRVRDDLRILHILQISWILGISGVVEISRGHSSTFLHRPRPQNARRRSEARGGLRPPSHPLAHGELFRTLMRGSSPSSTAPTPGRSHACSARRPCTCSCDSR